MLGRERNGRLRGCRRRQKEDVNPMSYMSNLVDAMLVLAVGIMLALVMSWNLQISSEGKITKETKEETVSKEDAEASFTEDDVNPADEKEIKEKENLKKAGTVYYDASTNTYYIIKKDDANSSTE